MQRYGGGEQSGVTDEQAVAALGGLQIKHQRRHQHRHQQAIHPGRFGPKRRGTEGLAANEAISGGPLSSPQDRRAIRTGLGHQDSVLDHWHQSPGPAAAPARARHINGGSEAQSVTARCASIR